MAGFPLVVPKPQFFDQNGDPLAGGTLESYLDGGTTPTPLYSDGLATVSAGTAFTLNARGEPATALFGKQGVIYKLVLKDAVGTTIYTVSGYQLTPPPSFQRYRNPAVVEGVTNEASELSTASAAMAGQIIFLQKGTYLVNSTWTLSAGTTYVGDGPQTVIKMQSSQLAATDLAGITFRNLKIVPSVTGASLIFTRCNDLTFEGVFFDNTLSGANPGGTSAIWLKGSDNVNVDRCSFVNCYHGVYAGDDANGKRCGTVRVSRCHFEHTLLSQGSYPAQVYQYQCDHMYVDSCSFKSIFPGGADPSPFGYCVYQGDGVGVTTSVRNSWATNAVVAGSTGSNVFAQAANTVTWLVENCHYNGGGAAAKFTDGSGRTLTQIVGNYVQSSFMLLQPGDGATLCDAAILQRNYFRLATQGDAAVRIGANGHGFNYLTFSDNLINASNGGGLFVNDVRVFAQVRDNVFRDCNLADAAFNPGVNEYQVSAIAFFGNARLGLVSGNHCENTLGGTGHTEFGFACDASTHAIDVRPDNRFVRMDNAAHRNTLKIATNPWPWMPPGGNYWFGDPASGNPPGRVCTHNFRTTISANEASGQTVLSVTSNSGLAIDDFVAVELSSGTFHYTFITAIGSGTITVHTALPSAANAGREVVVARFKAMGNLA